jgi:hypothetical protein
MKVSFQLDAPPALASGRASRPNWIGGWLGFRTILDGRVEEEYSFSCLEDFPDRRNPIFSLQTIWSCFSMDSSDITHRHSYFFKSQQEEDWYR